MSKDLQIQAILTTCRQMGIDTEVFAYQFDQNLDRLRASAEAKAALASKKAKAGQDGG